jgi:hypothetical protein
MDPFLTDHIDGLDVHGYLIAMELRYIRDCSTPPSPEIAFSGPPQAPQLPSFGALGPANALKRPLLTDETGSSFPWKSQGGNEAQGEMDLHRNTMSRRHRRSKWRAMHAQVATGNVPQLHKAQLLEPGHVPEVRTCLTFGAGAQIIYLHGVSAWVGYALDYQSSTHL